MEISDEQLHRYARHVILDEVGEEGQAKLLAAKVLVVGAGGLGAPLLMYLAAAGVGTLGVIDDDLVELSNLQRQVVHSTDRLGVAKVKSAAETVAALNPEVRVVPVEARLDAGNVQAQIADYDLVADGSDNFATRYLLNDACYLAKKTLVSAALLRFDGQLSTFKAHLGAPHPCYRCVFPEPPPANLIPRCEEAGIFGAIAGIMGSLQAAEVIKEILDLGETLSGRLLMYDSLATGFREIKVKRDPACALCGDSPTITDLSGHAA
ncbi:MAG: molybdopterin-synthase adenylyltransferase MoeB [Alphaproteobacteria bacterium]|nr:molybdopterin-synthase adenylyltransferase MoeB [Alphaproteobacteria bacterium]